MTSSGLPDSEFKTWTEDLYKALYKRESFVKVAGKIFEKDFNRETFFAYWEDQAFRDFIVESRFMTKARLTGHADLLIRWTDELERHFGGLSQFSDLVKSSFKKAYNVYDVDQVLGRDDFWRTVLKAAREDSVFAGRVRSIVEDIVGDRPDPFRARPGSLI